MHGFTLELPADWVRVPLDPGEFERFVAGPAAPLAPMLRALARDCRRELISLVAVLVVPGTHLLAATLTVSEMTCHAIGTDLALSAHTIAAALGGGRLTEVPAGPAVESVRVETDPIPLLTHRVFVPEPAGERCAVLTFATPNVDAGDAMCARFTAIAATFTRGEGGRDAA